MTVKRTATHPRFQHVQAITELLSPQLLTHAGHALPIAAGGFTGGRQGFGQGLEFDLIQVENGGMHGYLLDLVLRQAKDLQLRANATAC